MFSPFLVFLLPALAVPPAPAVASRPPRGATAGLALALEAGRYASGAGVEARYYQPVGAAGGRPVLVSAQIGVGLTGVGPRALVGGGGVAASLGWRHRALLALGWEAIGRSVLRLHGTSVAARSLYGLEVDAGYELCTDTGPLLRLLVGNAYLPGYWQEVPRWRTGFRVAFGWKLW